MASRIPHLTTAPLAATARRDGGTRQSTRGLSLNDVGFVHTGRFAQVGE